MSVSDDLDALDLDRVKAILVGARRRLVEGGASMTGCYCGGQDGAAHMGRAWPAPSETVWCPACALEAENAALGLNQDLWPAAFELLLKVALGGRFPLQGKRVRTAFYIDAMDHAEPADILGQFDAAIQVVDRVQTLKAAG